MSQTFKTEWICGNCREMVLYDEEPPSKCPVCGWIHGQRKFRDVPHAVKIKISGG